MTKRLTSLSLDLDNKWSYLKTHGDAGWDQFPTYLDVVVPRVLDLLDKRNLQITFFIVGQDAAREENLAALRMIADAGHEIGNHSFHHEPWLHLYSPEQIAEELDRAEVSIEAATGQRPNGFRGPGFSFSGPLHEDLARRGYLYDASTFPTYIGPLARAYYFMTARLTKQEREDRKKLFGSWREGFRPLKPYMLRGLSASLVEIPVTTIPVFRTPLHLSYVLYLAGYSQALAKAYFRFALAMCRLTRTAPSFLLHPLDFLGCDDEPDLGFFPGMNLPKSLKLELADWVLEKLQRHYQVVPMSSHAQAVAGAASACTTPSTQPS